MADLLHIIIPFYNSASTLERTIRSLTCIAPANRSQIRIVAIDDGSTDDSADIFLDAIRELGMVQHTLIRKTNGGSASARNQGLRSIATGWVFFLDADDELVNDPVPLLAQHGDRTAMLFATEIYRDGILKRRMTPSAPHPERFARQFTSRNLFHPSMVVFRRHCLTSLFDEDLIFLEDWHFWAVNRNVFSNCGLFTIALSRVNVCWTNKSSDQYNNGKYRVMAADKIEEFWSDQLDRASTNNLRIQRAIGTIQMAGRRPWAAMAAIPATPSLYAKLFVYFFMYSLYKAVNPYSR